MRTLALTLCLFTACDAGVKPAPPPPQPLPARPTAPAQIAGGLDLTYLAADSDLVISIDVAAARQSKLWAPYAADVAKVLVPGFAGCDYDPLKEISSIVIGVPMKTELGMFVTRGIDRDKALACLRKIKPASNPSASVDGNFVTLTHSGGTVDVLTFVDAKTMVMQAAKHATKETLQQALQLAAAAPLRDDAAFVAAASKLPAGAALRIVSRPGSEQLATKWKQTGANIRSFDGSVTATDRLQLRFALVLGSIDEATQFTNMMKSQLQSQQVKQMFDSQVRSQGETVTIEIGMSEDQLKAMVNMLVGMYPAL